jgi:hypothetical protein
VSVLATTFSLLSGVAFFAFFCGLAGFRFAFAAFLAAFFVVGCFFRGLEEAFLAFFAAFFFFAFFAGIQAPYLKKIILGIRGIIVLYFLFFKGFLFERLKRIAMALAV